MAAVGRILAANSFPYNPLVLYGRAGVGKSHLALGLARHWRQAGRAGSVVVATTEQFAQRLRAAIQADTLADFRAAYRSSAILVLEAIDRLAEQPVLVQHELIHTLDALQRAGRLLVITARVAIRTISGLDPLLTSRLVAGLALLVSPPTCAARLEILRQIANLLGLVRRT